MEHHVTVTMRGRMVLMSIVVMVIGSVNIFCADSTFVLRYDLSVGTSYIYHIVTDQYLVPNSSARLHSRLRLDVISRDASSNLLCRIMLTADTMFKEDTRAVSRPGGKLTFAGNKLYSGVGYLDLLFDEFGHIIRSRHVMSDIDSADERQSSSQRTMDAGAPGNTEDIGPYGVNLVIPTIPDVTEIFLFHEYTDTILFSSRVIHMPTNYGTSAASERKLYYDTLIRTSRLDSTCTDEQGYMYGYMTLNGERRNAFGARFQMYTWLIRDMRSGLITYVSETCQFMKKNKWQDYYKVNAELIDIRKISGKN